jgi:Na+(H+)/acetate symporter ActP
MNELYLGIGLAFSIYYIVRQLVPLKDLIKYKAYIDLSTFVLCVGLIVTVPTNMVMATTTWTGVTFSALLLLTKWFTPRRYTS